MYCFVTCVLMWLRRQYDENSDRSKASANARPHTLIGDEDVVQY
jgi:hypothetical protein